MLAPSALPIRSKESDSPPRRLKLLAVLTSFDWLFLWAKLTEEAMCVDGQHASAARLVLQSDESSKVVSLTAALARVSKTRAVVPYCFAKASGVLRPDARCL